MTTTILIVALVLILCVAAEKCSDRLGLPGRKLNAPVTGGDIPPATLG